MLDKVSFTAMWFIFLGIIGSAWAFHSANAGPGMGDVPYDEPRSLQVVSKVSNGVRFDIIRPSQFQIEGSDLLADWYSDYLLVVRDLETTEVLFASGLGSDAVSFVENGLSSDFVVLREWSGGVSCCLTIHAFRTSPNFKLLLTHNNDFFDQVALVADPNRLELHSPSEGEGEWTSHADLRYEPQLFNLESERWE